MYGTLNSIEEILHPPIDPQPTETDDPVLFYEEFKAFIENEANMNELHRIASTAIAVTPEKILAKYRKGMDEHGGMTVAKLAITDLDKEIENEQIDKLIYTALGIKKRTGVFAPWA